MQTSVHGAFGYARGQLNLRPLHHSAQLNVRDSSPWTLQPPQPAAPQRADSIVARVASIRPRTQDGMATSNAGTNLSSAVLKSGDYRIQANVEVAKIPPALRKNCVLFYTNDMEDLAKKVAAHAGGNIELGKIRWK